MAKNLWAKSEPGDTLTIYDRDENVTTRFSHEMGSERHSAATQNKPAAIEIASSEREVAERSVSPHPGLRPTIAVYHDDSDFQPHMI